MRCEEGVGGGGQGWRRRGDVDFSKALASVGCVLTKSRVVVISSLDKHDLINLEGTFQENCNGPYIRYPTFFVTELCFTSDRTELHFIADSGICSVHLTSILVLGGGSSCAASGGHVQIFISAFQSRTLTCC